ncbi:MAG: cephalosporin hydroxylase family protein [Proteobacteria bacterium]|nr:cephalosporin hydroxylase family protein [Pseudomonadota bacterium]
MLRSAQHRYTYNFRWLGRPVIQFPQDLVALQELIWAVRPGAIVETGIAHGGSLVFSASMLQLIGGDGIVVGVDVDIRAHNRKAIEAHPMAHRIRMVEGSSIDPGTVRQVEGLVAGRQPVMVILDSMHTHDHVLAELEAYSPLVSAGSWLVVLDTVIEDMPRGWFSDRPWDVGNNPKTAVHAFLRGSDRFVIDPSIADKLQITVAPDGWLRCVRD